MTEAIADSRLRYSTGEEVRLGDRVVMKRLLRRHVAATVCYIPGISPLHESFEYEDVRQWAVRADDGAVYPILYDPDSFQPPKRIVFVARGPAIGPPPANELL